MGSPLGPFSPPRPQGALRTPPPSVLRSAPISAPSLAPAPASFGKSLIDFKLPSASPKRGSIWDKEHISETLAGIGAGFFASQNFGDGLGAAAQTIAGRTRQLRDEERPDISYGGPGDQFEITADRRTGKRTVREVPEFRAAIDRAAVLKNRPDPKTSADLRGRALYAIATQIPPERRGEAYRNLLANPDAFGVDTTGLPAEWDETFGTLGGMMGLTVNQALSQERANALAKDTMRHRKVQEDQGAQRVAQGAARVAQGATRVEQAGAKLRSPPARVIKGYSAPKTKAEFDALPSGAKFMAPDGSLRIKP